MKKLLWTFLFTAFTAQADQLWVFYIPGCSHCESFLTHTYTNYPTELKKHIDKDTPVPLIRLFDLSKKDAIDIASKLENAISVTPTYILVDDSFQGDTPKELGRFTGYTNDKRFNKDLANIIADNKHKAE